MNPTIKIVGIDPALRNVGLALAEVDVITLDYRIVDLKLLETAPDKLKQVRKSSEDLAAAKSLYAGIAAFLRAGGAKLAAAEIPTGTQSARGCLSNGICIGLLGAMPVPLIEVNPTEVKMAAVGHKYGAKEEIIEWAVGRWPELPWMRHQRNGKKFKKGDLMNDNEHLADACSVIPAAIQTPMFQQAIAIVRAARGIELAA